MGWLVLKLTGNAASLGLVLAAGGVPSLLFGPWGGTIADRVDLRRLLIGTQLAFGLLAGLLWVLALTGHANVTVIVVISVASGIVSIAGLARPAGVHQLAGDAGRPVQRDQPQRHRGEQRPGDRPRHRRAC